MSNKNETYMALKAKTAEIVEEYGINRDNIDVYGKYIAEFIAMLSVGSCENPLFASVANDAYKFIVERVKLHNQSGV